MNRIPYFILYSAYSTSRVRRLCVLCEQGGGDFAVKEAWRPRSVAPVSTGGFVAVKGNNKSEGFPHSSSRQLVPRLRYINTSRYWRMPGYSPSMHPPGFCPRGAFLAPAETS